MLDSFKRLRLILQIQGHDQEGSRQWIYSSISQGFSIKNSNTPSPTSIFATIQIKVQTLTLYLQIYFDDYNKIRLDIKKKLNLQYTHSKKWMYWDKLK